MNKMNDVSRLVGARARVFAYASLLSCVACSATPGENEAGGNSNNGSSASGGSSSNNGGAGGTDDISVGVGGLNFPDAGPEEDVIVTSLPPGFIATEVGGFKLGAPTSEGSNQDPNEDKKCGNVLVAVVRDFKGRSEAGGHLDFEGPLYGNDITAGLVAPTLGADGKPVYASTCEEGNAAPPPTCPFGPETTSKANFDMWYRDTDNVNKPYLLEVWLAPQPGGLYTFQSLSFFTVDNAGWGNSGVDKGGKIRNFSFTTELHTRFQYNGGETFLFEGDDDVWVFINGKLAVDLGGLHPKASSSVNLDASAAQLGLVKGSVYALDFFHAERHTPESTFRIDTNLAFVDCGADIPE